MQRRLFRDPRRDLSREEYLRLLTAARETGQERLELLMEAVCSTGIRVSEVPFTVEVARCGQTVIRLKGKIRTILLPGKLCRKLLEYAQKQKTASGWCLIKHKTKSAKYTLTIEKASKYFRIGENKLRKLAKKNPTAGWIFLNGNRI